MISNHRTYRSLTEILELTFLKTLLLHQYFWIVNTTGLTVKNALTAMLYEKALSLTSRARGLYTHGEIVNMMAVDAQKFQDLFSYVHMVWSGPLQISLALYFLWQELGPSILSSGFTNYLLNLR